MKPSIVLAVTLASAAVFAQAREPDWAALQEETMRHYQALLRFDTMDPPGRELPAAEYLKQVFDTAGIPVQLLRSSRTGPTSSLA